MARTKRTAKTRFEPQYHQWEEQQEAQEAEKSRERREIGEPSTDEEEEYQSPLEVEDAEEGSNGEEIHQSVGGASTSRQGSPMQVELEQEDSVTCQWEDCGVVFTHLPTLIDHIHNEHIGVHKSSYTCEWASCGRRGMPQTSRFALISHIRSHTGEKPFICPLPECDKSFTRSDALAKHMRLQHNLTPPQPGRGGSRKRKRGAEDDGFNTFKVDPSGEADLDEQIAETSTKPDPPAASTSTSTKGKGAANGRSKRQTKAEKLAQAQQAQLPNVQQGNEGVINGDAEEGYMSSASDAIPPSLMPHYDETTGLVMGKSKAKVMYLLTKAKLRYAAEQNDILSEQLREAKDELEKEKEEKERALDELLHRMVGPEANLLIAHAGPAQMTYDTHQGIAPMGNHIFDQQAITQANGTRARA